MESFLLFHCPFEVVGLPQQLIKWQFKLFEARDEVVEGDQSSRDSLNSFKIPYGPQVCVGRNFLKVGLDPFLENQEAG